MNILILGSGGREHTFAWKLSQSPLVNKMFIAPGNAGTQLHGKNINISPLDFVKIRDFVVANNMMLNTSLFRYSFIFDVKVSHFFSYY